MSNEAKQLSTSSIHMIRKGFATGFPIMIGYLPVALTYGVLAKQAGMSLTELTLMSAMVYAGASQFMAVNMYVVGTGMLEIIIATFVLNFRHFVMSLSFNNQLKKIKLKWKIPLAMGLTDESFAVSAMNPKEANLKKGALFYGTIIVCAYLSWVIGSLIGGLLGDIIPERLSQSMGIALYAMFIGLLIPSIKQEKRVAIIAIVAMLINAVFVQLGMSTGWAIVAGTLIGGLSGIYLLKEDPA